MTAEASYLSSARESSRPLFERWRSEIVAANELRNVLGSPVIRRLAAEMNYFPPGREGLPARLKQLRETGAKVAEERRAQAEMYDARRKELGRLLSAVEAELETSTGMGAVEYTERLLARRDALRFMLGRVPDVVSPPLSNAAAKEAIAREIEQARAWGERLRVELSRIKGEVEELERSGRFVLGHSLKDELADVHHAIYQTKENLSLVERVDKF